jgi:hypothetical protein
MAGIVRSAVKVGAGVAALALGLLMAPRGTAPFVGVGDANAGACKIYVTEMAGNAHHKVFFASKPEEEKNAALIRGCKLVSKPAEADVHVFVTSSPHDASIKILRANFPHPLVPVLCR